MILEKIDRVMELDIDFDVLDAAIHRCLSNTVRGFVDFERNELTRATIVYILSQREMGAFAKVRIDKLSIEKTRMAFFEFREPFASNEKTKTHYENVVYGLLDNLNKENIWPEKQKETRYLDRTEIHIHGDMKDSNLIVGDKNRSDIKSTAKTKKPKK